MSLCPGLFSILVTNSINASNSKTQGFISSHGFKTIRTEVNIGRECRNLEARLEGVVMEERFSLKCSTSLGQLAILHHPVDSKRVAHSAWSGPSYINHYTQLIPPPSTAQSFLHRILFLMDILSIQVLSCQMTQDCVKLTMRLAD